MRNRLSRKIETWTTLIRALGMGQAAVYLAQAQRRHFAPPRGPYTLVSKDARYPMKCRRSTSDIDVFRQIFVRREYRCLDDVRDARVIIDCGAYVGYSSAYFLTRFPQARVVAVEPDPANYALLTVNLAKYGDRCRIRHAALWSRPAPLVFTEVPYRDGREWSRRLRMARADERPAVMGLDIGTLIRDSGCERVSILKIDVEGAEAEVFASDYAQWLGKVDNLVIELHGDECRSIFIDAIRSAQFDLSTCEELTVCKRRSAAPSPAAAHGSIA